MKYEVKENSDTYSHWTLTDVIERMLNIEWIQKKVSSRNTKFKTSGTFETQ